MYLKQYQETALEVRPSCVNYDVLPKGIVGKLAAGLVNIQPGGTSYSDPHTEWRQVFFILSGSGKLLLSDPKGVTSEVRILADTVVEIPYDTTHTVIADPGVAMRYLYVNDYSKPVK